MQISSVFFWHKTISCDNHLFRTRRCCLNFLLLPKEHFSTNIHSMYLFSSHLRYGHVSSYRATRLRLLITIEPLATHKPHRPPKDLKAEFLCLFLSLSKMFQFYLLLLASALLFYLFAFFRLFVKKKAKLHLFHYSRECDALALNLLVSCDFPTQKDDTQIFDLFL